MAKLTKQSIAMLERTMEQYMELCKQLKLKVLRPEICMPWLAETPTAHIMVRIEMVQGFIEQLLMSTGNYQGFTGFDVTGQGHEVNVYFINANGVLLTDYTATRFRKQLTEYL